MRPAPRRLTMAEIGDLLNFYSLHAPHRVPCLEAAYAGLITFGELTRKGDAHLDEMNRTGLPALILIGDDDGLDMGPKGWARAHVLARWAKGAVVHGAAGTVESYREAVRFSLVARRLVLVETGSVHLMAWHRLFANAGVPTVNYYPAEGQHPLQTPRRTLH